MLILKRKENFKWKNPFLKKFISLHSLQVICYLSLPKPFASQANTMNADQDFIKESSEEIQESQQGQIGPGEETLEKGEKPARSLSQALQAFLQELEQRKDVEEKIRAAMEFMKSSLASSGTPRFRDFWEARRRCLPLFKETMAAKVRSELWQEYIDLSSEAKRLKDILDEQAAFAYEQIELAIESLVKDLSLYHEQLAQLSDIELPASCPSLSEHKQTYNTVQKQLQLLNAFAGRINSLRKEVINTEMRIKNKNKLFDKLSSCGDQVFPTRKDLIKQISDLFIEDVQKFVAKHFSTGPASQPLHILREEIKGLQGMAKVLTLNTQAFTQTRLELSQCWDKIKLLDKERKKEISQKRSEQKQVLVQFAEKIKAYEEFCSTMPSLDEANAKFEEVMVELKTLDLDRMDQKEIKDALFNARKPILDKAKDEKKAQEEKEKELERMKKQKVIDLKVSIQELLDQAESLDYQALLDQKETLWQQFESIAMSKAEKILVDRQFKELKDAIHEKKSKSLLTLSQSDLDQLSELKTMLEERLARRQEIKGQIEHYRKALGGSGFDFEKAMMYRELIESEKQSLEKISASIDEIENKIEEIEG